jgi:hypothetical protein
VAEALVAARNGDAPGGLHSGSGTSEAPAETEPLADTGSDGVSHLSDRQDGRHDLKAEEGDGAEIESPVAGPGGARAATEAQSGATQAEPAIEAASRAHRDSVQRQREELPELALALMEAIRQAAVARSLTRQITRLLITAGEFTVESRPVGEGRCRKAARVLRSTGEALQRASEERRFAPKQQKELAAQIRSCRKKLERILERK